MARSVLSCTVCFRKALQGLASGHGSMTAPSLFHATRHFATEIESRFSTKDAPRDLTVSAADPGAHEKRQKLKLETAVKKHLRYMSDDPWAIGQYVSKALSRNAFDEALLLVQKASGRGNQLVVAWNHLIDYQLKNQQVKRALKIYNDMKKRAQLPNVKTFSVLFRGLSKSDHPKIAVAEAVKYYNVLLNDSRLEPNSIHLNAVLNVCARAGDLDNLFLIANTINDSTRVPDAYTYTTILNALRHHALNARDGLSPDQLKENNQKSLERAKSLWTEVIQKWNAGKLVIDEELVCAMGRLLLMSDKTEDKLQILDLLEQTMEIPNLLKDPAAVGGPSEKALKAKRGIYAVPKQNTLAMILSALTSTRHTEAGMRYWNLLVSTYKVEPDRDIWLRKINMLKAAKSSSRVPETIEDMPENFQDGKVFEIGMVTCLRDSRNHKAMKNATSLLETMQERLDVLDPYTLRLYLRIALVSHDHLRAKSQAGEEAEAKRLYGVQIAEALAHLWEPYKQIYHHYFKASAPRNEAQRKLVYNGKREVIALARQMVSASDKVVNEKMLPAPDLKELQRPTAKINREIKAFFEDRETREPRLPSAQRKLNSEGKQESAVDSSSLTQQDHEDDLTIKIGPQWVWDTYMPLKK